MEAVKRYGILTVGSVVLGISDYMFKFQNHFSFGGISGIAVIMSGLLGGSASTYTFVINMLLLVVAFILLGKEVAMQSAYVSVLYSEHWKSYSMCGRCQSHLQISRCWNLYFAL